MNWGGLLSSEQNPEECDATKADSSTGDDKQKKKTTNMQNQNSPLGAGGIKNVLLLGGAGFIGFNITKYLAENRNYKLTIADNFARGKQDDYFTRISQKT